MPEESACDLAGTAMKKTAWGGFSSVLWKLVAGIPSFFTGSVIYGAVFASLPKRPLPNVANVTATRP